jgi:uncharacterized protein
VAAIYFDTSALVRRYDRTEPGTDRMRHLCHRSNRHTLLICRLTPVEIASALNRKAREGRLGPPQVEQAWRLFRLHRRQQYQLLDLNEQTYVSAERLLFSHRLRSYDALQIACALRASTFVAGLTRDYRFCTADQAQAEAAGREGLAVELIG